MVSKRKKPKLTSSPALLASSSSPSSSSESLSKSPSGTRISGCMSPEEDDTDERSSPWLRSSCVSIMSSFPACKLRIAWSRARLSPARKKKEIQCHGYVKIHLKCLKIKTSQFTWNNYCCYVCSDIYAMNSFSFILFVQFQVHHKLM